MADNRKLAQGLMMMTPAMREDLARTASDYEKFKQADYLRKMGEQGMGLAKSVARGVPQMATGLVDLAAMPFEAAGVLQPGQAVGSTKWLENKGYLPEQQEGFANQLTELLSGGFDPSDLVTKGAPLLMGIGKTVWHGSPHTFDKFDLSKIGTGEGAQAYGHGLYFAESPDVAANYAPRNAKYEADLMKRYDKAVNAGQYDKAAIYESAMLHESPAQMKDRFSKSGGYDEAQVAKYHAIIDKELAPLYSSHNQGMYKVDLPDEHIAKMLDWDKPLSEQAPFVQESLQKAISLMPEERQALFRDYPLQDFQLGKDLKEMIGERYMHEAGIPGIQYLDQASRGAGEGTRNYVVFSDEIPQILERNNQPVAQALREYKQLESLNPTGTVMTEYNPTERATLPLGKNLTTLDVTAGVSPDEMVEIYRGVPQGVSKISPGDFITTNRQLAQDYAGGGNVISQKVPYRTILDDLTEPLGEEYIYRP